MSSEGLWADSPWPPLVTPSKQQDIKSHSAVYIADDMANVHNVIVRGMNSIYIQALNVHAMQDVKDFLFYIHCWADLVELHHSAEESSLFPAIERLARKPGLLSHSVEQHAQFAEGIHKLHDYARDTEPANYSGEEVQKVIKSFGDKLQEHLRDEVTELLGLTHLDSESLMKCHKDAEKAKTPDRPNEMFPLFFGLADNTYDGNGSGNFPPVPFFVPWIVHYWMARQHRGSWRFLPCDFWGQPRRLIFAEKVGTS